MNYIIGFLNERGQLLDLHVLEQAWIQTPHLQTCDTSKVSLVSGYASARFGLVDSG
jgi:hypothetical protein